MMQRLTKTEVMWIVNELLAAAIRVESISEDEGGNELLDLQAKNLRSVADKLIDATEGGDKRIAII